MRPKLLLLLLGLCSAYGSFAQSYQNELGLMADNDSFLGQGSDRYYTNGIFLYFRTALLPKDTSLIKNKILGFEVGQKIFNPQNGQVPSVVYVDRPFAGYLYGAIDLNLLYANESALKLTAQVGVIGPGALGEEVQTDIHNWFGFYKLRGWQYQIHDGAQLNLKADLDKLLYRRGLVDISLTANAALGNGFTGMGGGALIRFGNFNPLYHSISTKSMISRSVYTNGIHKHEFFGYYKPVLNYVIYNATIQGSLFNKTSYPDQITLTKSPFVFNNQVGVAYAANKWIFDAGIIFRTHEVKEMRRSEQWGSVAVSYRF